MDGSLPDAALGQPTNGYPRAEVEKFLHDVARERARLEAEIEDSTRRIKRAEAAVGTHRVMVTMLMQTQRELAQIRKAGEAEADRILQEAESQARAIERGAGPLATAPKMNPGAPEPVGIDLTDFPTAGATTGSAAWSTNGDASVTNATNSDEFFAFLRGALLDDQPLGPGAESP